MPRGSAVNIFQVGKVARLFAIPKKLDWFTFSHLRCKAEHAYIGSPCGTINGKIAYDTDI